MARGSSPTCSRASTGRHRRSRGARLAPCSEPPLARPGLSRGGALGTAAGKAADEALKLVFGQQRKTLGEEVGALGQAGIEGAVGEGAGRLVSQIPGAIGRAFRKNVTGSTPETIDLARSVADVGGVAPLRSVTPGLTSGIQKQDISAKLGADWLEARNRGAVESRLRDIIGAAGKTPDEIRTEMAEILNPAARVSAREAGQPIVGAVRQHAAQLEGEVMNLARDADRMLTGQLGRLNALSRRSPAGALGEDVAGGIAQARATFSAQMQKIYSKVDELIADYERRMGETKKQYEERIEKMSAAAKSDKRSAIVTQLASELATDSGKKAFSRLIESRIDYDPETGKTIFLNEDGSASSLDLAGFKAEIEKSDLFESLVKAPVNRGGDAQGGNNDRGGASRSGTGNFGGNRQERQAAIAKKFNL